MGTRPSKPGRSARHAPDSHGAGAGLALSVIPACAGCKAQATCHYFPTFRREVRQLGARLRRPEPPPGEQLRYLTRRLVAFVDPPFVKGAGWPSGAGLQSSGLVGIRPGASQVVFTSSCTLPAAQRSVCVDSAAAERSLYGNTRRARRTYSTASAGGSRSVALRTGLGGEHTERDVDWLLIGPRTPSR